MCNNIPINQFCPKIKFNLLSERQSIEFDSFINIITVTYIELEFMAQQRLTKQDHKDGPTRRKKVAI